MAKEAQPVRCWNDFEKYGEEVFHISYFWMPHQWPRSIQAYTKREVTRSLMTLRTGVFFMRPTLWDNDGHSHRAMLEKSQTSPGKTVISNGRISSGPQNVPDTKFNRMSDRPNHIAVVPIRSAPFTFQCFSEKLYQGTGGQENESSIIYAIQYLLCPIFSTTPIHKRSQQVHSPFFKPHLIH